MQCTSSFLQVNLVPCAKPGMDPERGGCAVQAANPELSMAQIRQLAGLAFERSEELVARQPPPGAPVPTSTPPSATNPGASTDVQASTAAGTTASRININGGAAAAQAEADAAGRVNGDASAADSGADTAGRLAYRADAGREEASTWANAFVSEAQRAADAAEQETRGHSRAGNARQESADLSRQPGKHFRGQIALLKGCCVLCMLPACLQRACLHRTMLV